MKILITKNIRHFLLFFLLLTLSTTAFSQVSINCWASWAGSGGSGTPGFTPTCSNQTLNVPSTGYTFWAPGAAGSRGGQYTFSATGTGWGTRYISVYYLNPGGAWVALAGGANTLTFTMPLACENLVNAAAAPYLVTVTNNGPTSYASGCVSNNGTNWIANSATLTYKSNTASIGSLTNSTERQFCDAGGNYTAAGIPVASGNVGKILWDWGSNNGAWNSPWQCNAASPGASAFPKKTSNSDAVADRTRYTVSGGGCADATATILISNYYNEAPTSLATSQNNYCSAAAPGTTTLTATFPTNINMRGTVKFYSGSCGGTLLGSVTPAATTSTAALSITAPTTTTDYYARYEPGAFAGCSNTACASVTLTVKPTPVVSGVTAACENTTPTYTSVPASTSWGTTGGTITSGGILTPPTIAAPTPSTNINITGTLNGCTSANYAVQIDNLPTITTPTAVCEGSTANVFQDITGVTVGVSSGSWTGSVGGPGTFTPPTIAGTTQNQTVTLTATNGACTPSTSIRVDNNTTATAGLDQAQCNNGNFTLAGNNPTATVTGSSGTWTCQANCAGIGYVSSTTYNTSMSSVPPNTTTTLRWTVVNGVCSNFDDANYRNDGLPNITGPVSNCDADAPYTYTQTGGSGIVWSYIGTNATMNSSTGELTFVNILTPTNSVSGTVRATSGSCATDKAITIYNKTTMTNSFASLCEGQSVTLTADVTGTTFSGTGVSAGVFTAPVIGGTSQSFILTATNGPTSCQDQQIITVYKPSTITSSNADMCQGVLEH